MRPGDGATGSGPGRGPFAGGVVESVLALGIVLSASLLGATGPVVAGASAPAAFTRVEDTLEGLPGVEEAELRHVPGPDTAATAGVTFTVATPEQLDPVVQVATRLLWRAGEGRPSVIRFDGRARTDGSAHAVTDVRFDDQPVAGDHEVPVVVGR
ncbi:MAG TPA: hypothetical protein VES95_02375 [Dermatophilaceae bacterium]|nr:hypothetical protein [Dermatophilaceae bacterium]